MKILKRLKVISGKQVGTLYHLTNLDGIYNIMKTNKLSRGQYEGISFTRNKMLNYFNGDKASTYFKLILDGDKLAENYKLSPFLYKNSKNEIERYRQESEEVIKVNEIKNISKYIKGVAFIYDQWRNQAEKYYRSEGPEEILFLGNYHKFLNKDLPELLKEIDKKYGLYVQLGTQIKKDNNWFKQKDLL